MSMSRAGETAAAGRLRRQGFTLLELLVVLTVIALLMTAAVPMLGRSLPGAKFRASAADLRSEFQQARTTAIRENRETRVLLDADAGTYRRDDAAEAGRLPEGVRLSFVTARQELTGDLAGAIRFYPDGTSTGGAVRLDQGGRARTIEIDWFDGRITSHEIAPE